MFTFARIVMADDIQMMIDGGKCVCLCCLRESISRKVKTLKAFKEDIPKWVYGVSHALEF